jgi:hypothetical protein
VKSGLAELNIVHRHSGHGWGALATAKMRLHEARKKKMIAAQAELEKSSDTGSWDTSYHRLFMGYVQSVTAFVVTALVRTQRTEVNTPSVTSTSVCHFLLNQDRGRGP